MLEHFVSPDNAKLVREVFRILLPYKFLPWTTFGVFILYFINRTQHKQPLSLSILFTNDVTKLGKFWTSVDVVMSSIVGGLSVFLLADPSTLQGAFVNGLGMNGIFALHIRNAEGKMNQAKHRELLKTSSNLEALRKSANFYQRICLYSGIAAILSGLVLTKYWSTVPGLVVAGLIGVVFLISYWKKNEKEQELSRL